VFGENVTIRRLVLMTILFGGFVLAGCSSSDETQSMATTSVDASELEGTWISDASALDQFEAFAALPKSDQGMVRSLHKNMYKGNTLTITSDTFSAGNPGKGQKETNYELSVVGHQGDTGHWTSCVGEGNQMKNISYNRHTQGRHVTHEQQWHANGLQSSAIVANNSCSILRQEQDLLFCDGTA